MHEDRNKDTDEKDKRLSKVRLVSLAGPDQEARQLRSLLKSRSLTIKTVDMDFDNRPTTFIDDTL